MYSCVGTIRNDGVSRNLTQVTGAHQPGRDHSHVVGFIIRDHMFELAPRDIYRFFPNLEAITFNRNGLKEITRDDIFGLPKLRVLNFHINNIKQIDSNLLENNFLIEAFSVADNPVRHVGLSAFKNANEMTTLHFHLQTCFDRK